MSQPKKASTLAAGLDRLERYMAQTGLASRREAKALITKGEVTVNGKVIREPGLGITPGKDEIVIKSAKHYAKESFLVYKSRGIETTKTTPNAKDLHDEFPQLKHLHPIGRLDKDSEGLIILSNDGTLAKALTKENSLVGKEYFVTVREAVTDRAIKFMSTGIMLDKVVTKPATVKRISDNSFKILLHEGRKHQIRRMADACSLTIEKLVRVKIGHLAVGSMKPSNSRLLSSEDITKLKR